MNDTTPTNYLLLIDSDTIGGPDTVSDDELARLADIMRVELAEAHVDVRSTRPGETAGLYVVDASGRPTVRHEADRDLACSLDDADLIARTIVWPDGQDREHRDRVVLAHMAKRDGWQGATSAELVDVPTAADWVVDAALVPSERFVAVREEVNETLNDLCHSDLSFDEAAARLEELLP